MSVGNIPFLRLDFISKRAVILSLGECKFKLQSNNGIFLATVLTPNDRSVILYIFFLGKGLTAARLTCSGWVPLSDS